MSTDAFDSSFPQDQAHGLRRLFAQTRVRLVPVVSNPHMAFGGVLLERLCTALAEQDARVLLVDAAERSPQPQELAVISLAECIEQLSPKVSYMAARGLPLRFVDAHGSTAGFLQAIVDAAPETDVLLVHASASEQCRLFARQTICLPTRPLLLADDRPASVTHAYAAMKLMTLRAKTMVYHLLLGAAPSSPRAGRIAEQLAGCADIFLGSVLQGWTQIDPAGNATDAVPRALQHLAATVLQPVSLETEATFPVKSPMPVNWPAIGAVN